MFNGISNNIPVKGTYYTYVLKVRKKPLVFYLDVAVQAFIPAPGRL